MHYPKNISSVFTRYDLNIEAPGQTARKVSTDRLLQDIADCLVAGSEERIKTHVRKALETRDPMVVINRGLIPGMQEVNRLWDEGVYFLPQVILSADAMINAIELCEQRMIKSLEKKAFVVTHTVEGDIHEIGQSIVNALLDAAGFKVVNLGADVAVDDVVDACRTYDPVMVTGTALMTTAMRAFPRIARRLKQADMDIPFICGGGAVIESYVTAFDLGICGREANQAPAMAEDALGGLSWREMRRKWNG